MASPRPLLVTSDSALLDELVRIAATVGTDFDVRRDIGAARGAWVNAAAVFVDEATVGDRPPHVPRRDDVVLVGFDVDSPTAWERAVKIGAQTAVFLPAAESWLADYLADLADGRPVPAPLVAVVGGRGGAGATTLAAALSLTAARRGQRVVLLDGDPLGGGIDLALGGEDVDGLRWPDLAAARGRVSGGALVDALPRIHGVAVLSWDRTSTTSLPAAAMAALVPAAQRGADLVVVDLPRRIDDVTRVALDRASVTLVVVPAELRATAAAARVVTEISACCSDLRIVVRGPAPGNLGATAVAASLGLPLAAALRAEPRLASAYERGEPPGTRARGPLATFCAGFLAALEPAARRPAA
jgi:secretion/DNA translocation related CpaE-like protein